MTAYQESPPVAPDALRALMRQVPTGVMVITTRGPGGQHARTANSFTSVSLSPALVSVCFGIDSPFVTALGARGLWGVSVLAADQHELSSHFARRETGRTLDGVPHTVGAHSGAALLTEAVATMECQSVLTHPAGDHVLIIGEVISIDLRRDAPALVFYRGGYHAAGETPE